MKHEVVIVGSGPAGSVSAMSLIREGIKPLIIESEPFPRYHIGESLTGAAGGVLRELGLEAEMIRRKYPTKQGVHVHGHSAKGSWFVPVTGRDPDWNLFDWDTWQVRRSDFDAMLLQEAVARGASVITARALKPIQSGGAVRGVQVLHSGDGAGKRSGNVEDIESEVLLDCSGQATWLANLGGITGPKYLGSYDKQIAIFSQVANPIRDNGPSRDRHRDNTHIFYKEKYHWSWFIPIDDEVVSVGVVCPAAYFLDKKESRPDFLKRELHELHPELKRRITDVKFVEDVRVIRNYSYQVKNFSGNGFLCVGDSHRFIDPIFSFGVTVAMREAQMAAPRIKAYLEGAHRDQENPFAAHEVHCEKGIDVLEDSIDLFWENSLAFAFFVHSRYTAHMTDMFAGRIYERQPSPALDEFRSLLGRTGQREASYESNDAYSIPIGSRYHPERASLWQPVPPEELADEAAGKR